MSMKVVRYDQFHTDSGCESNHELRLADQYIYNALLADTRDESSLLTDCVHDIHCQEVSPHYNTI